MKDLDLTTLRLFVAACDLGNIARAGDVAQVAGRDKEPQGGQVQVFHGGYGFPFGKL